MEEDDFSLVSKSPKQEICSNPIYFIFEKGAGLELGLDPILNHQVDISRHKEEYILINIKPKNFNIIPTYPKFIERHIRIDRNYAAKGDKKDIFRKMHFTWIFEGDDKKRIEFRGYFMEDGSCVCYSGETNTKKPRVTHPWLDIIKKNSTIERNLFSKIELKLQTEFTKAKSRRAAQYDKMVEPKYLMSVDDDTLEIDLLIYADYFEKYCTLSDEKETSNALEVFKANILTQVRDYRNPKRTESLTEQHDGERSTEVVTADKKFSKAQKKRNKKNAKKEKEKSLKEDIADLIADANEIDVLAHNVISKGITIIDWINERHKDLLELHQKSQDWLENSLPILCELPNQSEDFLKIMTLKSEVESVSTDIQLCLRVSLRKPVYTEDPTTNPEHAKIIEDELDEAKSNAYKLLLPIKKHFFKDLFSRFLNESYLRALKDEAEFNKRFSLEFECDSKDKFERSKQLTDYIFEIYADYEHAFKQVIKLLVRKPEYLSAINEFSKDLSSAIINHANPKNQHEKEIFEIFMEYANIGFDLIVSDMMISSSYYTNTIKQIFAAVHSIRAKIRNSKEPRDIAAFLSLGEATSKSYEISKPHMVILEANLKNYSGMLKCIQNYLTTAKFENFENTYLSWALEKTIYNKMIQAQDALTDFISKQQNNDTSSTISYDTTTSLATSATLQSTILTPGFDAKQKNANKTEREATHDDTEKSFSSMNLHERERRNTM